MDKKLAENLGDALHAALASCKPIDPLTNRYSDLSIEQAYQIQQCMLTHRLNAGDKVIGKKIGVTSQAVMDMLKVNQPDFGYMLDSMRYEDGAEIPACTLIQPKAEGEIAFVLKSDLQGPGVTPSDVLTATDYVMTCFEIVDSRITDWKIKIQDTVADNASCGAFVLGKDRVSPHGLDLIDCAMTLTKNGEVVVTGKGAATMGSPLNAVAWLANMLGTLGIPLKAGEIILSGALGAMVPVRSGDKLSVTIDGIGSATVNFTA